ncbi:thioredoxin family protein [Pseudozobellia thermophila]|uniref:Thioredoxin n=1 Tax=Pseudozobellia thermophila TaxID=192903 RepID=A0A1M6AIR9_9FLAO|nr:thioredoxin family protein [Pseudozobellia thermophila]SHI36374.1 Thioredoxin [Pseudozobellia thermophila]
MIPQKQVGYYQLSLKQNYKMPQSITDKSTAELIKEALPKAVSYTDYRAMVSRLASEGRATGPKQTEALANYTLLNDRRMKRFDKTVKLDPESMDLIKGYDRRISLLVLTESWCGDAAPSLPVMNKIAELSANIDLKIVLRDENLELMDRFLTRGAMSIPKLIVCDRDSLEVLAEWGPRPEPAAKMVARHKEEHGKILPELKEELQQWYNKDKGKTILKELLACLPLE